MSRVFAPYLIGRYSKRRPNRARTSLHHRRHTFEKLEDRCLLAITVDTLVDEMDGSINDGDVSLRDAITLAPAGETINFSVTGVINLEFGQIEIDKALTIEGPGSDLLTLQAKTHASNVDGDGDRIFSIDQLASNVSIIGLTLSGGDPAGAGGAVLAIQVNLSLADTVFSGNTSTSGGGLSFSGTTSNHLSIDSSRFDNNRARLAVPGGGDGGGVYADVRNGATISISDSIFQNNDADYRGGGLDIVGGSFTGSGDQIRVQDSLVTGNFAGTIQNGYFVGYGGGGISVSLSGDSESRNFVIERSNVSNNQTFGNGAGIHASSNILNAPTNFESIRINRTTISGNVAFDAVQSAGINGVSGGGGGITLYVRDANTATIISSTISGNRAINGGGIFIGGTLGGYTVPPNDVRIRHSTITDNKAGPFEASEFNEVPAESQVERVTVGGGVGFASGVDALPLPGDPSPNRMPMFDHTIVAGNLHFQNEPALGSPPHTHEDWNYSPDLGASPLPQEFLQIENSGVPLDNPKFVLTANYSIIGSAQNYPLWNVWSILNVNSQIGIAPSSIDPVLGPLADNGGFVLPDGSRILTHEPLPGSPAIDTGDPGAVPGVGAIPLYDQRDNPFTRVYDGNGDMFPQIDIGAIEIQPIPLQPCPIGDYNDDGIVNAADYTVWRDNLGTSNDLPNEDPAVTPGEVTPEDYEVWKLHFGETCSELGAVQLKIAQDEHVDAAAIGELELVHARRTQGDDDVFYMPNSASTSAAERATDRVFLAEWDGLGGLPILTNLELQIVSSLLKGTAIGGGNTVSNTGNVRSAGLIENATYATKPVRQHESDADLVGVLAMVNSLNSSDKRARDAAFDEMAAEEEEEISILGLFRDLDSGNPRRALSFASDIGSNDLA